MIIRNICFSAFATPEKHSVAEAAKEAPLVVKRSRRNSGSDVKARRALRRDLIQRVGVLLWVP
jgi:hypothetical protein